MNNLKIKQISTQDLIPYVNNARVHTELQVAQIAASIKEFGFNNPVLTDGDNGVIAGHGRLLAAKKLGIEKVPAVELSHLSETQKKAYILADNRLAELASWDDELVRCELEALSVDGFDELLTGFNLDDEFEQEGSPDTEVNMDDIEENMIIKLEYSFDEYQEVRELISNLNEPPERIFKRALIGS